MDSNENKKNQDYLTNLYNRQGMVEQINKRERDVNHKGKLALILINVKQFKWINRGLGHEAGDALLVAVAKRLQAICSEFVISRQWGDEFGLLVDGIKDEAALHVCMERVHRELRKQFVIDNHALQLLYTLAGAIEGELGVTKLLEEAEIALMYAKEKGETVTFFSENMGEGMQRKMELMKELTEALRKKEFILYYQPQIDMETKKICGVEALIRWKHAKQGIVTPGAFISVAEESDLILPIGKWVIEEVCRQSKEWKEQGVYEGKISVNISQKQFLEDGFISYIKETLTRFAIPFQSIELEITESLYLEEKAHGTIKELREIGIQLSIDDFGTGYSSLQYLQKCPVHTLKIAPQFVMNLDTDISNKSIVAAITSLAKQLQLQTIAEGVETEAQFAFLQSLQCCYAQGYLFSPPLPPSLVELLFEI